MFISPPTCQDAKKIPFNFAILHSPFVICLLFAIRLSPFAFGDGTIDLKLNPAATTTISATGSYRVVDNVTMNAGIAAITLTWNDITIDLGGHTITGGGGAAVDGISGSAQTGITIFDGTIAGFSQNGIYLGGRARMRNVEVRGCAASGILVGNDSIVEKCRANGNNTAGGSAGIQVGQDSVVKECVASANNFSGAAPAYGVYLSGTGCQAEKNLCENNVSAGGIACGIYAPVSGCRLADNVCRGNQSSSGTGAAYGIYVTTGFAVVLHNLCESNSSAGGNGCGIYVNSGIIENNTCANNTSNGLYPAIGISGSGTIRANVCYGNSNTNNSNGVGIAAGGGSVEANVCYSNNEGPNGNGNAYGISAAGGCIVVDNTCRANNASGADGIAVGIYGSNGCVIRSNTCSGQVAAGVGFSAGILAAGCRVLENHCTANTGGTFSHGIRASGSGNPITGNSCEGNGTAGLIFFSATHNRSESNRFRQTTGIDLVNGVAPASAGAGDLADVTY